MDVFFQGLQKTSVSDFLLEQIQSTTKITIYNQELKSYGEIPEIFLKIYDYYTNLVNSSFSETKSGKFQFIIDSDLVEFFVQITGKIFRDNFELEIPQVTKFLLLADRYQIKQPIMEYFLKQIRKSLELANNILGEYIHKDMGIYTKQVFDQIKTSILNSHEPGLYQITDRESKIPINLIITPAGRNFLTNYIINPNFQLDGDIPTESRFLEFIINQILDPEQPINLSLKGLYDILAIFCWFVIPKKMVDNIYGKLKDLEPYKDLKLTRRILSSQNLRQNLIAKKHQFSKLNKGIFYYFENLGNLGLRLAYRYTKYLEIPPESQEKVQFYTTTDEPQDITLLIKNIKNRPKTKQRVDPVHRRRKGDPVTCYLIKSNHIFNGQILHMVISLFQAEGNKYKPLINNWHHRFKFANNKSKGLYIKNNNIKAPKIKLVIHALFLE